MRISSHYQDKAQAESYSIELDPWMQPRVRRQQIQNFRAFIRHRVKCLDSSIRWKMETLSSICGGSNFLS